MKKRLLLFFLIITVLALFVGCSSDSALRSDSPDNTQGGNEVSDDVVNLEELPMLLTKVTCSDSSRVTEYYTYNSEGLCVRKVEAWSGGSVNADYSYEYDENGHIITETCIRAYGTDNTDYLYDDNGQCISMNFDNGRMKEKYEYEYDSSGNVCTETYYYESYTSGSVSNTKTEYERDSMGRVLLETVYNLETGNVESVNKYTVEDNRDSYVITGAESRKEYRTDGKILYYENLEDEYSYGGGEFSSKYEYDDAGNLVKRIYVSNNFGSKTTDTYTYEYLSLNEYTAQGLACKDSAEAGYGSGSLNGSASGSSGGNNGKVSSDGPEQCAVCHGAGQYECSGCDGSGLYLAYYSAYDHSPVYKNCNICSGTGMIKCKGCGGDGTIRDGK